MSGNMQVKDDPNTGGGLAEVLQTFFFASQKITAVDGTPVTDHEDHTNVKTANGSSFFHIDGKPVNFFGNADTCGHTRAGTQVPWFTIQS